MFATTFPGWMNAKRSWLILPRPLTGFKSVSPNTRTLKHTIGVRTTFVSYYRKQSYPNMLSKPPIKKPTIVAQGLIPSAPKTIHTRNVPAATEHPRPHNTHRVGTKRSVGSKSSISPSYSFVSMEPVNVGVSGVRGSRTTPSLPRTEVKDLAIISRTTGEREIRLSETIIAKDVHNIQPRAPDAISPTGPGAQPLNFDSGESTPQPTSIPYTFI